MLGDKVVTAVFDNSKPKRVVPVFAAKMPFATGIRRTLAWFEADPITAEDVLRIVWFENFSGIGITPLGVAHALPHGGCTERRR